MAHKPILYAQDGPIALSEAASSVPKMIRRSFIAAIGALFVSPVASAQQRTKMVRLGLLIAAGPEAGPYLESFKDELRKLGWIDGRNMQIEFRSGVGDVNRLPALVAELIRLKVDLIVASTTPGALAAKSATSDIPIVFGMVSDPVASGVVASLSRPGGNLTGWSNMLPETTNKLLEMLKEAAPKASRIAVLYDAANAAKLLEVKALQSGAQRMGMTLHEYAVRTQEDIRIAFHAIARERHDGLVTLHDTITSPNRNVIVELAAAGRIPAIFQVTEYVDVGGLMSYGLNVVDQWRRSAYYVDRILRGAKPSDLPVEQPMTFEFAVNLKTAKALGIVLPQSLLVRANRIVQ